ncbi:hypothetical protein [Alcanivorax sp.]|nr:hypothetical protein [Alcanivorax sp.]
MYKILSKFKYGDLVFHAIGLSAIGYGIYMSYVLFNTPTFKALWTMASS